jgi:hypothetical protein
MESPWTEWLAEPLPRVIPAEQTIGGRIRARNEDFEVEEIPAYEPSGEGDHLFLWIEKKGRNTQDLIEALARQLHIPAHEIGTAGMKDRYAVTRQYVSVPQTAVPPGHSFESTGTSCAPDTCGATASTSSCGTRDRRPWLGPPQERSCFAGMAFPTSTGSNALAVTGAQCYSGSKSSAKGRTRRGPVGA